MTHDIVYAETLDETLEDLEQENAQRIIRKLGDIADSLDHFLDSLKDHPGYKLRVCDFRVLINWDKDAEMLYAIDVFERKREYRELGKYREIWGSWRDTE